MDSMFGRKQKRTIEEMDRQYGAAQLMALYQLPRFSDAGPLTPDDDRETTLRRICIRIVAWGVSDDDPMQRASDHSFWMFACDRHAEEVVRWDEELSRLSTERERREATVRLRSQYQAEFEQFVAEQQ